jgi:hypothetical protein
MERNEGFYWVKGFKWDEYPRWFVAHWMLDGWWYDNDDFSDDCFVEIDEKMIVR